MAVGAYLVLQWLPGSLLARLLLARRRHRRHLLVGKDLRIRGERGARKRLAAVVARSGGPTRPVATHVAPRPRPNRQQSAHHTAAIVRACSTTSSAEVHTVRPLGCMYPEP